MGNEAIDPAQVRRDAAVELAAEIVDHWGATSEEVTGRWLDPRNAVIGVGITDEGDDEATRALLQARLPASVRVCVRLVSARWVRLRQVQVHVADFLDDEGIWGRYAVSLGIDQREHHVEVGLLPSTSDSVAARILHRFPTDVTLDRQAGHAIAL